jgi:bacterioferritin
MGEFLTDVQTLRARAREEIEKGPVTSAYGADVDRVVAVLNEALATEIVCTLRYKQHYFAQLGGAPDFNPETLTARSHAEYRTAGALIEMIREDLVAERIAIASYTEIISWLGDKDPTTRRLIESVLENEEEHADDLLKFLEKMSPGEEARALGQQ